MARLRWTAEPSSKYSRMRSSSIKKFTETTIDLVFVRMAEKGVRRMKCEQFLDGVAECAKKKGISEFDLKAKIIAKGGPTYKGTKTDFVRWHNDKSLYTGVYAKGGPTNVDKDKITSISQTCDRTPADIRSTKK
eukprot:TRINITY_DN5903_c0_g1_i2.p1 TRINITY_DN5903_c0_g1~~TRINITY_DN5903_c0_g1_i2.p1  ORF type:complete len:134 (-),score=43.13 TRINITY_DN5903_c0_g1_i2:182-583(-)